MKCEVRYARGDGTASGPCLTAEEEGEAKRTAMETLRKACADAPNTAILLNYHMGTAGQRPFGGHISPLGAYHRESRRLLVLDVWPQTRASWLCEDALWAAMCATDPESGRSRGWLSIVTK